MNEKTARIPFSALANGQIKNSFEKPLHVLEKQGFHTIVPWQDHRTVFRKFCIEYDQHSDLPELSGFCEQQGFQWVDCSPDFAEIMPACCSKASAMAMLCDRLKTDQHHCYAFGDSVNDLPMLRYAGHSVLMGNGDPSLRHEVEWVTDPVDQDGLAKALNHYELTHQTTRETVGG